MTTVTVLIASADDERSLLAVRAAAARFGGHVADCPDGGAVIHFQSVTAAVSAALAAIASNTTTLRLGVAVGEREADNAAAALQRARALSAAARPGEILGDVVIRVLLTGSGIETSPHGQLDLGDGAGQFDVVAVIAPAAPDRPRLRVVVADDAALIRAGLVRLLADEGFEVVAEVSDATALLAAVDSDPPDLVVTDVRMPPGGTDDGIRAAATIRQRHPHVAVLVLSQYVEAASAATLLDAGAAGVGYLLKERVSDLDAFVAACHEVAAGGRAIDPAVGNELLRRRRDDDALARLTDREREVLALMASGRSNAAIASALIVSDKTLEAHVRAIFQKLDLPSSPDDHRRVAAVIRFLGAT
jgi:DNA-binding NarL/FixJ family response regulator